jgi:hypothetical protein
LHLSLWEYLSQIYDNTKLIKDDDMEKLFSDILSKDFDKWWITLNSLNLTKKIDFNIWRIMEEYKKDLSSSMDMQWMELTEQIDENLTIKIREHCFEIYIDFEPMLKGLYSSIRLWDTETNDLLKNALNKEIKKYWITINNIEIMKKDMNLKLDDILNSNLEK